MTKHNKSLFDHSLDKSVKKDELIYLQQYQIFYRRFMFVQPLYAPLLSSAHCEIDYFHLSGYDV